MPDVHVVDTLTGEAWGDLLAFLLYIKNEWKKSLDVGWWNVISVRSLNQRFSFEVENGDQRRHGSVSTLLPDFQSSEVAVLFFIEASSTATMTSNVSSDFPKAYNETIGQTTKSSNTHSSVVCVIRV